MVRIRNYKTKWNQLIAYYGSVCVYCEEEMATSIDHVVPHSYDQDDSIENLVPACALCNSIAGNKMFEDFYHKQQYILNRRKQHMKRRAICTECLLPFAYREHSPSLFLCAECYDREYGTGYSSRDMWKTWLRNLEAACIFPEAHRMMRKKLGPFRKKFRQTYIDTLAGFYQDIIDKECVVIR